MLRFNVSSLGNDVREFYSGLSKAERRKSIRDLNFYKRRKRWTF